MNYFLPTQKITVLIINIETKVLTSVTTSSKVSMTTATFIRPDTHLIFLAGEVAFAESWGEPEQIVFVNWLSK